MRTPVNTDREQDAADVAKSAADLEASEQRKLFPHSSWEFQKWTAGDARAFAICCVIALSILGGFSFLLTLGRQ